MKNKKATVRYAFQASLPVMAGYIVLGIGFGVLLTKAGYSWWWAPLMCLTIYAGSMQYVAVELLVSGATLAASALMTLMVNIRHLFYGIVMLQKYGKTGKKKPYLIFAMTDETFSLVCTADPPPQVDLHGYYLFLSLFDHLYWIIGGTVGAVMGELIPFNAAGVDFAMTALFTVIFVEQWEKAKRHLPALTGIGISLVCLLLFGAADFLLPAMIGITAALFLEKPLLEEEHHA